MALLKNAHNLIQDCRDRQLRSGTAQDSRRFLGGGGAGGAHDVPAKACLDVTPGKC